MKTIRRLTFKIYLQYNILTLLEVALTPLGLLNQCGPGFLFHLL